VLEEVPDLPPLQKTRMDNIVVADATGAI